MSGTYLPCGTRQRIQDLIKDSSITQAEPAGIIGLSESAFSRYLKGQTEMLGDGYIIKIAKHFNKADVKKDSITLAPADAAENPQTPETEKVQ